MSRRSRRGSRNLSWTMSSGRVGALIGVYSACNAGCLAPPDINSAGGGGACETKGREGGKNHRGVGA